jgi:hypothetical protein
MIWYSKVTKGEHPWRKSRQKADFTEPGTVAYQVFGAYSREKVIFGLYQATF